MRSLRVFAQTMRALESRNETFSADFLRWLRETIDGLNTIAPSIGDVRSSVDPTARVGELEADGSNVSRTTYAALFALIGVDYGAGDGVTTFTLPGFSTGNLHYFVRFE
jgi:hypothetical protein